MECKGVRRADQPSQDLEEGGELSLQQHLLHLQDKIKGRKTQDCVNKTNWKGLSTLLGWHAIYNSVCGPSPNNLFLASAHQIRCN